MKLQPDRVANANVISGYTPGGVQVAEQHWRKSFVLPWEGRIEPWGIDRFEHLAAGHFERLAALAPELVLFGSGRRLRFPPAACLQPLIDRRIGFETMDTAAACRTFNLLVAEGRRVVAALLLDAT